MVPSKRPAPRDLNSSQAKRPGRPPKNEVQGNAASDEAAKRLSESTVPYQHENVDQFVGQLVRGPGHGWSEAHENAMNMMWSQSNHSTAVAKMREIGGKTTQGQLLTLFKVCLRVFKISPIRFVSFSHHLEYLGERGSSATFSKAFSEALTRLIVHPAFNGKRETLATVIQYAVICRIDNRRPWPDTAFIPDCPALAKVVEAMKASETDEFQNPIHGIHTSARLECWREGKSPSKLSDLMHAVGETVKESNVNIIATPEHTLQYRGEVVWPVSLYDLRNITKTLDETTWEDDSWNCTAAQALQSYHLAFPRQEIPNGDHLSEYYERSHKQKLRDWMVKSGYDPQQQLAKEAGDGLKDRDEDMADDISVPDDNGTTGLDLPPVRVFSQTSSNPYASLESQDISSPEEGSLNRIKCLEKQVSSLRQQVASFKDQGSEIAILKAEVASLKEAVIQNQAISSPLQLFSAHILNSDNEAYMDWNAGMAPF